MKSIFFHFVGISIGIFNSCLGAFTLLLKYIIVCKYEEIVIDILNIYKDNKKTSLLKEAFTEFANS
ncbi:MAG: hypothetical protein ACQEQH_06730 [Bacillota bacterium]